MELTLILRVLLRRWYLVLIPVVIVAVVVVPDILDEGPAVSGGYTTTVRYTAAQELDAIPNRDGDYQDVWLASELTVNAFTEWVRTSRFAQEVAGIARESGLEIDPGALSIAADNERSIGQIFINWDDEGELLTIAQAVITVLQTRSQVYFPQLGDVPAQVTLLDEPRISPAPVSLPNRFAPFIKLALGVLAGIGVAFLVEYLDPTLRTREELQALGLPVIAGIPKR
jgi:capsular polysaccharide biosynthesis protein